MRPLIPPSRRADPRRADPRGVTLIELVIAVAILALGAGAAWSTLDSVRRGVGGQAGRALAQEVALNRAAELRLAGPGASLPGVERMGGIDWTVSVSAQATAGALAETEIRVSAPGQPSARLLVWLPTAPAEAQP